MGRCQDESHRPDQCSGGKMADLTRLETSERGGRITRAAPTSAGGGFHGLGRLHSQRRSRGGGSSSERERAAERDERKYLEVGGQGSFGGEAGRSQRGRSQKQLCDIWRVPESSLLGSRSRGDWRPGGIRSHGNEAYPHGSDGLQRILRHSRGEHGG